MKTFDWIVIGAGIAGASLSYELAKTGFSVMLIDQFPTPENATRYSYGGLAYWAGYNDLTYQLCQQGRERHQVLSEELGVDTQLREVDLVLTVPRDTDPETIAANYPPFVTPPRWVDTPTACELEPLLNPEEIAGAFTVRHGHILPEALNQGYVNGLQRLGGTVKIGIVSDLIRVGNRINGVIADGENLSAANVVVCAGGMSRELLKAAGIKVKIHFTHTEVLETPKLPPKLRTVVMSATMPRFGLEAIATQPELEELWDEPHQELAPFIIDPSAVQLLDGRLRIGQPSRTLSNPKAVINQGESEATIREAIAKILPSLADLPATWYHCLVAFTGDGLPMIGAIPNWSGIHVFSGFSNPLVFVPPLAQRYGEYLAGKADPIFEQLSPSRSNVKYSDINGG
ncbi:MAG: FAD-binding oxidoreductase [Arthrospira sp. PLM2.Bin9]|nr:FAD-binding oxidoreductase [Arthrospira sp. PLM2.Bin9]TVU52440.1 MAG: FAD-binding oxidoreductase [Arthrospira sp. PLM2.Bin9]